jgi:hypothetical protein
MSKFICFPFVSCMLDGCMDYVQNFYGPLPVPFVHPSSKERSTAIFIWFVTDDKTPIHISDKELNTSRLDFLDCSSFQLV